MIQIFYSFLLSGADAQVVGTTVQSNTEEDDFRGFNVQEEDKDSD